MPDSDFVSYNLHNTPPHLDAPQNRGQGDRGLVYRPYLAARALKAILISSSLKTVPPYGKEMRHMWILATDVSYISANKNICDISKALNAYIYSLMIIVDHNFQLYGFCF
jgi:hypothetical protein